MDREGRQTTMNSSSSMVDIDQLCQLIDQNKFGLKIPSSTKYLSNPSSQLKIFRSSRLKRLNSSPTTKSNENYSSLLIQFRTLSTSPSHPPPSSDDEHNSRRTSVNSCNVEELTSYIEHYFHLPKALSSAAELMYT